MLLKLPLSEEFLKKYRRAQRLKEILYSIKQIEERTWKVESSHDVGKTYDVFLSWRKGFLCQCRWWALKHTECLHISAVKEYLKYQKEYDSDKVF